MHTFTARNRFLFPSLALFLIVVWMVYACHKIILLSVLVVNPVTSNNHQAVLPELRKSSKGRDGIREHIFNRTASSDASVQDGVYTLASSLQVFYHIYFDSESIHTTMPIVQEQLTMLSQQLSRAFGVPHAPISVHVVSVGNATDHVFASTLLPECARHTNIHCVHEAHYRHGYELRTLLKLYQYCTDPGTGPSATVLYMHSKGTFHDTKDQKIWRALMLQSIASLECMQSVHSHQCDACGLLFGTHWAPIFPGNFFASSCEYVQKLVVPDSSLEEQMESISRNVQNNRSMHSFQFMYPPQPWNMGTGRYAAEHWIGSHPSLRPCDMSPRSNLRDLFSNYYTNISLQWSMAPRFPYSSDRFLSPRRLSHLLAPHRLERRKVEYFMLAGRLHQYQVLYHGISIPPATSWIWKWYPDGETYWKERMVSE